MQQSQSIASVPVFRELEGAEASAIFAHDLEQAIIDMLATDEFKERAMAMFLKTGRFGSGACFPVVYMQGKLQIKVYASVESARSQEKMPPLFEVAVDLKTGEMKPDSEEVVEANVEIRRVVGVGTETAVDKARLEVGLTPLVPQRTQDGAIVNAPGKHEARSRDYEARFAKSKATVLAKKEAAAAAQMSEEDRERLAKEQEARGNEGSNAAALPVDETGGAASGDRVSISDTPESVTGNAGVDAAK